ncbi:MAG: hypothetical protein ACYC6N_05315 [Pirellulaceae bacterium]
MIVALGLLAMFAWQGISPPKTSDDSSDGVKQAVVAQQTEKQRPADKPAPAADKATRTEDKPIPDVSDSDAGPVWGEVVDGLQLGVSGIRQDRHFKSGDTIRFRLSVRNVGTEPIRFQYKPSKMCDWVAPLVEKANGERVQIHQMFFRGGHNHFTETLEPKAEVSIPVSGILVLGASDTAEKTWPSIEKPEPGEYRLRGGFMLQRLAADGKEIIQRDPDGKRTVKTSVLNSGTITFHID